MLVLSRKKNESIVINENIVITIIEIRGDKVRLGIQAPRDVSIHRSEVYEAIKNGQLGEASGGTPPDAAAHDTAHDTPPAENGIPTSP